MGMIRRRRFLQAGAFAALGAASFQLQARVKPFQVVIVGGGFAGSACALQVRKQAPGMAVTLIDPAADYVTCPMSNEALIGMRALASLSQSRRGLERAGVRVVRARVHGGDLEKGWLRLDDGSPVSFDRLVVAPGIRFLSGMPEGYDEAAAQRMPHAWKAGAQTALLAAQLRAMRDGGVVAIAVPGGLMRCPPAPFERASLIAGYLKAHKPRSKILIFDANNHFPRQEVFTDAWRDLYPGMIEWIPVVQDGAITRVDASKNTLYTSSGTHRVAVANVIPPQAPGQIALDLGLCSGHGWCPVKPVTFESTLLQHVHVVGDACIAGAMPKSASAGVSQARQCALAIVASLRGLEPPNPLFESVCYSVLGPQRTLAIRGHFEVRDSEIRAAASAAETTTATSAPSVGEVEAWYQSIVAEAFDN
jgi:sulfide dehydrogenase [flavocytochrome c] flavoprotein chain